MTLPTHSQLLYLLIYAIAMSPANVAGCIDSEPATLRFRFCDCMQADSSSAEEAATLRDGTDAVSSADKISRPSRCPGGATDGVDPRCRCVIKGRRRSGHRPVHRPPTTGVVVWLEGVMEGGVGRPNRDVYAVLTTKRRAISTCTHPTRFVRSS